MVYFYILPLHIYTFDLLPFLRGKKCFSNGQVFQEQILANARHSLNLFFSIPGSGHLTAAPFQPQHQS